MRTLLLTLLFCLPIFSLQTAYVKFDHPEGWKCELAEGVWICQSTLNPDRRESLVMSIAALASEWDSIENFEEYLKQPRELQGESSISSEISYTRRRNINGHIWIDSLQHNSELPGFWTRYLATVNQKLAVLITYIVSDEHYSKLAPQFERMVVSLALVNDAGGTTPSQQGENALPGPEKLGISTDLLRSRLNVKMGEPPPPSSTPVLVLLFVLAAAAAFIVWRRKKATPKPVSANAKPPQPSQPH